jgi:hypothetical protein
MGLAKNMDKNNMDIKQSPLARLYRGLPVSGSVNILKTKKKDYKDIKTVATGEAV